MTYALVLTETLLLVTKEEKHRNVCQLGTCAVCYGPRSWALQLSKTQTSLPPTGNSTRTRKTIHPYVSIKYLEYAMKAKAEERESVYMNTHQGKSIYAIKPRATSFPPLPEPHKALVVTRSNSASILSSACPCTFWASRDLLWHYPLTAPHTVPATLKRSSQSRSLETPAQSALCIPSSWKSSTHSGAIR